MLLMNERNILEVWALKRLRMTFGLKHLGQDGHTTHLITEVRAVVGRGLHAFLLIFKTCIIPPVLRLMID